MPNKTSHISETPATQQLREHGIAFREHVYDWQPHGGAKQCAQALGVDAFCVIKTLVMHNQDAQPLVVLMHGNCNVSTKALARQTGMKRITPCPVAQAQRHSGYLVGGTSPFGLRHAMPIFMERSILQLPSILLNGGRRGYLIELAPQVCVQLLNATPVDCAIDE